VGTVPNFVYVSSRGAERRGDPSKRLLRRCATRNNMEDMICRPGPGLNF